MPIRKGYFERRGFSKTSRLIGFMICNVVRGGIAIIPIIFYNQVFSTTTNVSAAYMGVTLFFLLWATGRWCQSFTTWWNWGWHVAIYGLAFVISTTSLFCSLLPWVSIILFADIIWSFTTALQHRPYGKPNFFDL